MNINDAILKYFIDKNGEMFEIGFSYLVYLADWKYSLITNQQMSDINWDLRYYLSQNIVDIIEKSETVERYISHLSPYTGQPRHYIRLKNKPSLFTKVKEFLSPYRTEHDNSFEFSDNQLEALNHVQKTYKEMKSRDFTKLVYSTYPMFCKNCYWAGTPEAKSFGELAKEYKELDL